MPLELARTPEQARQAIAENLRNSSVADDRIREHVRIVAGLQPYDHSHFAADRFFQFDSSAAVVTNVYGQRMLRVTGNLLRSLRRTSSARWATALRPRCTTSAFAGAKPT